jgi:hypothetical protein
MLPRHVSVLPLFAGLFCSSWQTILRGNKSVGALIGEHTHIQETWCSIGGKIDVRLTPSGTCTVSRRYDVCLKKNVEGPFFLSLLDWTVWSLLELASYVCTVLSLTLSNQSNHSARLDSKESSVLLLHETRLRISISNPRIRNPFRRAHGSSNNSRSPKATRIPVLNSTLDATRFLLLFSVLAIPLSQISPLQPSTINHHLHCRRGKNEVLGSSFSQTELHS